MAAVLRVLKSMRQIGKPAEMAEIAVSARCSRTATHRALQALKRHDLAEPCGVGPTRGAGVRPYLWRLK